jgi:hypothetical protein
VSDNLIWHFFEQKGSIFRKNPFFSKQAQRDPIVANKTTSEDTRAAISSIRY